MSATQLLLIITVNTVYNAEQCIVEYSLKQFMWTRYA